MKTNAGSTKIQCYVDSAGLRSTLLWLGESGKDFLEEVKSIWLKIDQAKKKEETVLAETVLCSKVLTSLSLTWTYVKETLKGLFLYQTQD